MATSVRIVSMGEVFGDFVRRSLLPILQPFNGINPCSVVIMDNASDAADGERRKSQP